MEQGLASVLVQLPPDATLLMYEAEHAGALRLAGIPLRHVISEAEHPDWEMALLDPAHHADYAIGCKGDPGVGGGAQPSRGFHRACHDLCALPGELHGVQTEIAH